MSGHSAGPWQVYGTAILGSGRVSPGDIPRAPVICENVMPRNRALISAAPDLLAALRHFAYPGSYTGQPTPEEMIAEARAAIAKAEGV